MTMRYVILLAGVAITAFVTCPLSSCAIGSAAAEQSGESRIGRIPAGWQIVSQRADGAQLKKRVVTPDGVWFEERMTLKMSRGGAPDIEQALAEAGGRGFAAPVRQRLDLGSVAVPFWMLHRLPASDESEWLALLVYDGTVYCISLRATPHDESAPQDLLDMVEGLRLAVDRREKAWSLLGQARAADARSFFDALLREDPRDANARYGLALAQIALGETPSAIRNLEMARPVLGLSEDTRRALGQAELQNNRPARAAALWIQVMRDNPEWEAHLRPLIASVQERLPAPRESDSAQLIAISTALAGQARRGDAFELAQLRDAYRDTFTRALDACLADQCALGTGLLAAYDIEQGLLLTLAGRTKRDETIFYEGTVRLASGWRQFGSRAPEAGQ